ncbi:hypothetical protein BUALT_Bualt05G0067700 [Buddleja alternifolia]|uniref:Uncharacterized protein n=1 Tax=Buddleja alternifolia TaxID=168488 RepID=A0AAV6XT15_9LAMI|nr:hypothetical protein BUALT_Bualt05G0067700 [Buddleja alternifolia]
MKRDDFSRQTVKNALWASARATRIEEFKSKMQGLKDLDEEAYDWLVQKPPSQWSRNKEPESYVHDVYKVHSYLKVYENTIQGVTMPELWPKCNLPPPLPPVYENRPGRPQKIRKRGSDEPPAPHATKLKRYQRRKDGASQTTPNASTSEISTRTSQATPNAAFSTPQSSHNVASRPGKLHVRKPP